MNNLKRKYLLFLYKENDRFAGEYGDNSQYITQFTDSVDELANTLWTYAWFNKKFNPDWDITTVVGGVVVDKNSFKDLMEQKDAEAEQRRLEYEKKMADQRAVIAEAQVRIREEQDKREWARLKGKYGS